MEPDWLALPKQGNPFHDPSLRAYLDALPKLLNEGYENGYFVCDKKGKKTAAGKTQDEAIKRYYSDYGELYTLAASINGSDIEIYKAYYDWKVATATSGIQNDIMWFPG